DKRLVEARDQDFDDSRATSRRGSVQDSADGDADAEDSGSELSELEDMDEDKKRMLADFENAEQHGNQESDDSEEDAGKGGEADDDDEEMQDPEDEVEIQDSQENVED